MKQLREKWNLGKILYETQNNNDLHGTAMSHGFRMINWINDV